MNYSMIWIKTQDKQSLINAKEITVKGEKIVGVIGVARVTLDQWSKDLGKYESNERALEILDEIFMEIEDSSDTSVTFTMPKE